MPKVKPFVLTAYPALKALGFTTDPGPNIREMAKLYEAVRKEA